MKIRNSREMLRYLGARSRKQAQQHVAQYSDCSAILSFTETGIAIVVPTENAEVGATRRDLNYPFESATYEALMQAVEDEATAQNVAVDAGDDHNHNPSRRTEFSQRTARNGPGVKKE